ncbi:MAG TPA: hypothetical protein VII95_05540 [Terriglobales bacterium]|jgi:hypothetical protein|nr:hypothetical protein [Candidatus Limnocylindrales bacterium]
MSIEEAFLQQFAKLFVRYRDALTLDTNDDRGRQLERLNEAAERDRMFAAGRLALLEMETNAHVEDNSRHLAYGREMRNGVC